MQVQPLTARELLVAEGDLFQIETVLDTAGLVGALEATVDWGDGTQSTASSVIGGEADQTLQIRFDYSFDSSGFFGGANTDRRALLQLAADSIVSRFTDRLDAITPSGIAQWVPRIFHPSQGSPSELTGTLIQLPANLVVPANEIVVYVGARDLPGNNRAVAGPGSRQFPAANGTPEQIDQVLAFRETVDGRGQSGALANPQTDVAPWGGSISFDNQSDWFFGTNQADIAAGQIDFITVATHEIAHILGFGIRLSGATTAWERLTSSGRFSGPKAVAAYQGQGNVPLDGDHWAASIVDQVGQPTVLTESIQSGRRQLLSPLDFAAMDDLGWDVIGSQTTVIASHRYPDDGTYPVEVTVQGAQLGQVIHHLTPTQVTNVQPTLDVISNQSVALGQPIFLEDIGSIRDPGFRNLVADPPTAETFSFSIDWGDGSPVDSGSAMIDDHGNGMEPRLTTASFDGSHLYQSLGTFPVTVEITDDDGGSDQKTFMIQVTPPPQLTATLADSQVRENQGEQATTLTIRRTGPSLNSSVTVQLESSDTSEATVPSTIVIPSGQSQVMVPVRAIDDALLDGDKKVTFDVSAAGFESAAVDLIVADHETLTAVLSGDPLREGGAPVSVEVTRSNSDTSLPLQIQIDGGDPSQLIVPATITIPADQITVSWLLSAIDDEVVEAPVGISIALSASGYQGTQFSFDVIDDEPPLFQNANLAQDVNDDGNVTALDALRIINELFRFGGARQLDPENEQPAGVFLDVNGDYLVTALDALNVINRLIVAGVPESARRHDVPAQLESPIDDRQFGKDDRLELYGSLF